tara:strand:- start:430 stop:1128 length:699 start_codon:yes stop_codon:yes gene_type:complete
MKKIFITTLSLLIFCFSNVKANQDEFMSYEDFLFDVKDLLDQTVKVQVLFNWLDIPSRVAHIDYDMTLAILMEYIERDKVLNIVELCDIGTTCWLDVEGVVIDNSDYQWDPSLPKFLIEANSVKLHFLVGYAISETGQLWIGASEEDAINALQESNENEAYLSDYLWIDEPGTLAIGFGSGLTEFYASYSFNKDAEAAIASAVKDCDDHVTGILNLGVKCEPITMDIPWWSD